MKSTAASLDPRLTPEVKRLTFSVDEKSFLYRHLKSHHPNVEKMREIKKRMGLYIRDLIIKYLYPEEIKEIFPGITPRYYIHNDLTGTTIPLLEVLGIKKEKKFRYQVMKGTKEIFSCPYPTSVGVSLVDDDAEEKLKVLIDPEMFMGGGAYQLPVRRLLGFMTEEELIAMKNMISDFLALYGEHEYYLSEWVNKSCWYKRAFDSIATWGALYKINPEWFDIIYNNYYRPSDSDKETVEEKLKAIEEILGL